eukprot:NODE_775_length_4354_cov_0.275206.p4 type:complete len:151 gc:universal NODE_775_length_4354_cov_0.275206:3-455(+)
MHNSLPIKIPFYLKFYFNSIENDILQLYKENISQLYEQSNIIFSILCNTLTQGDVVTNNSNYVKLTKMDLNDFEDILNGPFLHAQCNAVNLFLSSQQFTIPGWLFKSSSMTFVLPKLAAYVKGRYRWTPTRYLLVAEHEFPLSLWFDLFR